MWRRGPAFHPPEVPLDGSRRWILRMAFDPKDSFRENRRTIRGPEDSPPGEPLMAEIDRLGLGCRIGSRFSRTELSRIFGPAGRELLRARREAAIRETLAEETLKQVAERARSAKLSVVALKGVALLLGGWIEPGARGLGDVDLLLREEEAALLSVSLRDMGFEPIPEPEGRYHHHLPPLIHETLSPVELHTRIPGVRIDGESVSAAGLLDAELARRSPLDASVILPHPPILAAHAIAHSLHQERFLPDLPAFFRMIGDLLDLPGDRDPGAIVDAASPYLGDSIPAAELEGVRELSGALARGEMPAEGSAGRRLLRHELALAADPEYRRSFRQRRALHALKMGGLPKLLHRILGAIRGR